MMEVQGKPIISIDQIGCNYLAQQAMSLLRLQYDGQLTREQRDGVIEVVCRTCPAAAAGCLYYDANTDQLSVSGDNRCGERKKKKRRGITKKRLF